MLMTSNRREPRDVVHVEDAHAVIEGPRGVSAIQSHVLTLNEQYEVCRRSKRSLESLRNAVERAKPEV